MDRNTSFASDIDDPLFRICWRRQSCGWCLEGDVPCSWCAVTSTCVPNPSHFPILAPVLNTGICPLGQKERWELRAPPFGCHVSTVTFLSVVVSVLGTVSAIGAGVLAVRLWKKRSSGCWEWGKLGGSFYGASDGIGDRSVGEEGDLEGRSRYWGEGRDDGERRPLLAGG
ncbi:uncharacterized protein BDW47DRAFT_128091 [Aspergillus candidus]|uniref:PSI domain-containing protein n=1 Tax=Aspergillus candidus TaxID=41067 RepID=A0A2I2F461_ASPCN|nr:hypothetical protein BDW47DRAFT_128091 [Aspergillus candidus]PLB35427.1 hypothetical protein BDW47DRAFT_128091 [Aspergillus candidus]